MTTSIAAARGLGIILVVGLLGGCDDEPPVPSGNLARPSGLAYIERSPVQNPAGGRALLRSDLLIADSEAQGVRIAQFVEAVNADGEIEFEPPFFVPAPVPFFKLAAEAPGFPTRVAATPNEPNPARAFVLAPTRGEVHILEVGETAYQAPSTVDTNFRIGGFDLLEQEPNRVAVELALVGVSANEDFVLVAFDGLGAVTGQLVLFAVDRAANPSTRVIGRVEVPSGVTDLLVRADLNRILVNSVATGTVSEVPLTGSAEAEDLALGDRRGIDVGGPTIAVIDAGDTGAFALRADRSAAVWLRTAPDGAFVRDTRIIRTPYDGTNPGQLVLEPGVLTLRSPGPVTGAYGRLRRLGLAQIDEVLFDADVDGLGARDVVLIVHADAQAIYLIGTGTVTPPAVAVGVDGVNLRTAFPSSFQTDGTGTLGIPGCGPVPMCIPGTLPDIYCDAEQLTRASSTPPPPFVGNVLLRVTPYGPLFNGAGLAVDATVRADDVLEVELVDASRTTFDNFRLEPGDGVRLTLQLFGCAGTTDAVDALLTGRLVETGVGEDRRGAVVRPGASLRAEVTVAVVGAPTLTSTAASFDFLRDCAAVLDELDTARDVQVHIPDDRDEAVVAQVGSELIARVLERVPIDTVVSQDQPGSVYASIQLGSGPETANPLRIEVRSAVVQSSTSAAARSLLECQLRSQSRGDTVLGLCQSGTECGIGRACMGATGRCPGTCTADCGGACFDEIEERVCQRLDLEVAGPGVQIDLPSADLTLLTRSRERFGALPDDAIFHPQRQSFFVSLPGGRAVIEVPTGAGGPRLLRLR